MNNRITKDDVIWCSVYVIGLLIVAVPAGLALGFAL